MNQGKLQAIILDFDGVVLNSSILKSKIFERFYSTFDKIGEEMIAFHYANKGMSRYNQFIELCKRLGEDTSQENVDKYIVQFRDMLMIEMFKCPFVDGAEEFLEYFHTKLPLFVASNSPKIELETVVNKRAIEHCFVSLYGTTFQEKKTDFIIDILNKGNFLPEDIVFIGDTKKDMTAARECGVNFIGVDNELVQFSNDAVSFDSLYKIKDYIIEHYTL